MMMVDSQANMLPPVPDQRDYIADAAARNKSWADCPSPRPRNLDLRPQLSLLCKTSNSLAMMRSTTLPSKKRKIEVSLTDNSSEKECLYKMGMCSRHKESYRSGNSSVSADSDMHSSPPDYRHLKWLVTARRGRKSFVSSTEKSTNKEEDDQLGRVPLQDEGSHGEDHNLVKKSIKEHGTDESAAILKQKDTARFADQAIDAMPIAFFDGVQVVNMFPAGYRHNPPVISIQQNKVNSTGSGNRFKCNECDKSFTTHQALGGHKTSHNKRSAGAQEKKRGPLIQGDHRCKICDETFPTGQALGGHQRRHYVVPSKAPASATTSTLPTSQESAPCMKIFGFDLNQLPEVEADEDCSLDLRL